MPKKTIKLLGEPTYNEDDKAAEAITPGHLVTFDGSGNLIKHNSAGGICQLAIAHEREEMGQGIDVDYAIDDTVKVGVYPRGTRFLGFAASGQNLTKGGLLESAGNGTFRARSSGQTLARILETTGALTALTRIRCEAM